MRSWTNISITPVTWKCIDTVVINFISSSEVRTMNTHINWGKQWQLRLVVNELLSFQEFNQSPKPLRITDHKKINNKIVSRWSVWNEICKKFARYIFFYFLSRIKLAISMLYTFWNSNIRIDTQAYTQPIFMFKEMCNLLTLFHYEMITSDWKFLSEIEC